MRATVEVNFRFPEIWYDAIAERRRTSFNMALRQIDRKERGDVEQARKTIQDLAAQKYPLAMHLLALWMLEGGFVSQDPEQARKLIAAAAEKDYGPALYEVGMMHLDGRGLPLDTGKGLRLLAQAAVLGSHQAQFHLGAR